MKTKTIFLGTATLLSLLISEKAAAQTGEPYMHDPSAIMEYEGKYYTFGTGGGELISEDGWTWNGGGARPGRGAAPDAVKIGDRYLIAYSTTGGGLGGSHHDTVLTMWNKILDPEPPDFKYTEAIAVALSEDNENYDVTDTGLLPDPTDGRLRLSYGTYFGFIRLVELDPVTDKRVEGNEPINIAIDCEATDLIYRNGWYYLFGTHSTCCDGSNSTYNIVVGRSRKITGLYIDDMGRDMLEGDGKMVLAAGNHQADSGHFGRFIETDGVEKMSCHFGTDFDRGGRSVLAIRPLLWKNDWPVTDEVLKEGAYEIESERRGYGLELAADFVRMAGVRHRSWEESKEPVQPLKPQTSEEVIGTWPQGSIDVRIGDYMFCPHQRWTVTVVLDADGYLGTPYYKIVIEGTNRALTATADTEVSTVPEFTGASKQLWRMEQLTDGTYRIMPKKVPGTDEELVLVSVGDSTPPLGKFDVNSDNSEWNFRDH